MNSSQHPTTGIAGLDLIIDHLRLGDNVVWQVDHIDDYAAFVTPYVQKAIEERRKIIYIRFAQHRELAPQPEVTRYELDARLGFESFSAQVHGIVAREGLGAYYVFDCLSDLLSAWATDLMIGNFFRITCPHLFQLNTIAYFALIRRCHSYKTIARIRETTQLLLDLYSTGPDIYIHPLKVQDRYTPTMFLPHKRDGAFFRPVTSSIDLTRLTMIMAAKSGEQPAQNLDSWERMFMGVRSLVESRGKKAEIEEVRHHLCSIMIGREARILDLAMDALTIQDLLAVKDRLIGSGYIGGKAAGMLIARKLLLQDQSCNWQARLEPHDSFFIGSDVFYTYIVANGWWPLLMKHKTPEGYFDAACELRELMLEGSFPAEIEDQFWTLIEYFGQSPIIVRSSSLLEDAFGNAFAGKYESVFCVNQGSPEERFRNFRQSVRRVFASTMDEDALAYRRQRGLADQDEQMALLVQRVSGFHRGRYFFPDLAGVGISYNTFVWKPDMDPRAGMLRLVLGLGTRAVNRVENDYPRVVPLDAPLMRAHGGVEDVRRYSQRYVDVLNIDSNTLETVSVDDAADQAEALDFNLFGAQDTEVLAQMRERGMTDSRAWLLTFDPLLSDSSFAQTMQGMLKRLEQAYRYPVDTEFTVNFGSDGDFQINLVQCRPLQTKGGQARIAMPESVPDEDILFQTDGNFMGTNVSLRIQQIIYVDPEAYGQLPVSEKYTVARLIGKLNRLIRDRNEKPTVIIGPGRWGTSTPSLGVPVRFAEINNIAAMVELEHLGGNLMPELSFGTHFFQDLVETDICYAALFVRSGQALFNGTWLDGLANTLADQVPEGGGSAQVLRVFDTSARNLRFMTDIVSQRALCFGAGKNGRHA